MRTDPKSSTMPTSITLPSPHLAGPNPPQGTRHILIFFLTGNPGLVDYYEPFLARLRALLNTTESKYDHRVTFHIHSTNYAGFSDNDHPQPFNPSKGYPPNDVESEIEFCVKQLHSTVSAIPTPAPRAGEPFDEVILIGHSLGTYIALEIFHRHLHDSTLLGTATKLKAGVLLFATIAHLAKSPKGVYLDTVRRTPWLGANLHRLAKAGLWCLPDAAVRWYLRSMLGMPPHAEETTFRFLRSRDGVYQALFLGMDEMRVISDEVWAEELWEVAEEAEAMSKDGEDGPSKFYILFGKEDHWVANEYRDRFIKEREAHASRESIVGKKGRTKIVVDEEGVPHDFCISKFDSFHPTLWTRNSNANTQDRSQRDDCGKDRPLDRGDH